jgi:hypothetical protein
MFQVFLMFFRLMLQVFYLDVAKLNLNIAYVAMAIHVCFKRMFQVFHLFQKYVASVSSGCFNVDLVLHMLQWRWWLVDDGLLLGRRRGSPCGRLWSVDASAACFGRQAGD